jgi:Kef-type K+ transport system membrane component KefB
MNLSFLHTLDFSLPFQNSVLVFSVILFIILFAPIILNKFKVPHLIGLIIAGAIIGKHGFHVIEREEIELYGAVGLLYIMFLAGLEIDMVEFKKNTWKSLNLRTLYLHCAHGYWYCWWLLFIANVIACLYFVS